jgi:hypothetical protein
VLIDLVMSRIKKFDTAAIYISGADEFREFLSTAWSSETESMVFCFKPGYWEEMNAIENRLNISTGDLMRLFICSYLFPSGKTALRLKDMAAVFAERKAWQYNILLTRPVMELLSNTDQQGLAVNLEVIIRAAHFYYASGLGEKPHEVPGGNVKPVLEGVHFFPIVRLETPLPVQFRSGFHLFQEGDREGNFLDGIESVTHGGPSAREHGA